MKSGRASLWTIAILLIGTMEAAALQVSVRKVSLGANDLVYDSETGLIYASVPSTAGAILGNTITAIDPVAGKVGSSTFVGSEPDRMAVSSDGSTLYVGLDGAAAVRSFDTGTSTAGQQFSLGGDSFFGPYTAEDLSVSPGHPGTVAVSRENTTVSTPNSGIAIYDNGVIRPTSVGRYPSVGADSITFGADNAHVYGFDNADTGFDLTRYSVNASGITAVDSLGNLFQGFGTRISFAGGLLYGTDGHVVDPLTDSLVGTFAANGPMVADPKLGLAFFITSDFFGGNYSLKIFDLNRFVLLQTIPLTGVTGNLADLIQWGEEGLAFRTTTDFSGSGSDTVYLLSIPEPDSGMLVMAALLPLAIARRWRVVSQHSSPFSGADRRYEHPLRLSVLKIHPRAHAASAPRIAAVKTALSVLLIHPYWSGSRFDKCSTLGESGHSTRIRGV